MSVLYARGKTSQPDAPHADFGGRRPAVKAGTTFSLLLCGVLFATLITFGPWEALRGEAFKDLFPYVRRIELLRRFGTGYFDIDQSWIGLFKAEDGWFWLSKFMADLPFEPRTSLLAVTFISSVVFFVFLAQSVHPALALILLVNPIVIDLLASQVRSALAMALFLLALMIARRLWVIAIVVVLLAFIHTSMFVVGGLFFACVALTRLRLSPGVKAILLCGVSAGTALGIGVGGPALLDLVGDRRAEYHVELDTPLYVAFWFLFGCFLLLRYTKVRRMSWRIAYAAILCVSVPLVVLLGFPGFRFIPLSYPIIASTIPLLDRNSATLTVLGLVFYQAILFTYWILA